MHLVQVIDHGRVTISANRRLQRQQRGLASARPERPYGSGVGLSGASEGLVLTGTRHNAHNKAELGKMSLLHGGQATDEGICHPR